MLDLISKGIAKVFGTKSDKDIKKVQPYVGQINEIYHSFKDISDDDLRDETRKIRETITKALSEIDARITALNQKVTDNPDLDIHEKEEVFKGIDDLEEERNELLEEVLMQVLPQSFAVVKETARRFKENHKLTVTATLEDKALASHVDNVEIQGSQAIWHNQWIAGGNEITWDNALVTRISWGWTPTIQLTAQLMKRPNPSTGCLANSRN